MNPAHISGRLSFFFYNFANIRIFLGIEAYLKVLYLSDETFKQKNKSFEITFGSPIPNGIYSKTMNHYD
ncbi:MAG: hypothetical protein ABFS35_05530 [Bacteroidota bacterium]